MTALFSLNFLKALTTLTQVARPWPMGDGGCSSFSHNLICKITMLGKENKKKSESFIFNVKIHCINF